MFLFPINIFFHDFLHNLILLFLLLFLLKDLEFGLPSTKSREPYHVNHYWFSTLGAQIEKFVSVLQVLCWTITEMQARNGGLKLPTLCTRKHVWLSATSVLLLTLYNTPFKLAVKWIAYTLTYQIRTFKRK